MPQATSTARPQPPVVRSDGLGEGGALSVLPRRSSPARRRWLLDLVESDGPTWELHARSATGPRRARPADWEDHGLGPPERSPSAGRRNPTTNLGVRPAPCQ